MPMLNLGDAGEPAHVTGKSLPFEPRHRLWSLIRSACFGFCLVTAVVLLALSIGAQHDVVRVPSSVFDAVGIGCGLSLIAALAAGGYDALASRGAQRFAVLHHGQLDLLAQTENLRHQVAELSEAIKVYAEDKRQDGYEAALRDTGYRMPMHGLGAAGPLQLLHDDRAAGMASSADAEQETTAR